MNSGNDQVNVCKREECPVFYECDPDHKGYVIGELGKLAACEGE